MIQSLIYTLIITLALTFHCFVFSENIPEIPGALYGIEVELPWEGNLANITKYYDFNSPELRAIYLEYKLLSPIEKYRPMYNYLKNSPLAFLNLPEDLQQSLIGDSGFILDAIPSEKKHIVLPDGGTHEVDTSENPILNHLGDGNSIVWKTILFNWHNLDIDQKFKHIDFNNFPGKTKAKLWFFKWGKVAHHIKVKQNLTNIQYELLSRLKVDFDGIALEFTYIVPSSSANQMYDDLQRFGFMAGIETQITNPIMHLSDPEIWGSMHHHISLPNDIPPQLLNLMNQLLAIKRIARKDINSLNSKDSYGFSPHLNHKGLILSLIHI